MSARMGTLVPLFLIVLLHLFNVDHVESKTCTHLVRTNRFVPQTYWSTYLSQEKENKPNCWFGCKRRLHNVVKTRFYMNHQATLCAYSGACHIQLAVGEADLPQVYSRYLKSLTLSFVYGHTEAHFDGILHSLEFEGKHETSVGIVCCPGYMNVGHSTQLSCLPICSKPCINGFCQGPDQCACNSGFVLDPKNNHSCLFLGPKSCVNETGVATNTCQCEKGYQFANGICQPVCREPCTNGTCIAPDYCQCSPGYEKTGQNTCAPHCSSCSHGSCIAPETCICNSGWRMTQINGTTNSSCQPICTKPCTNGTCIAPETCQCFAGYIISGKYTCKPYCSTCSQGSCIAPETCICNSGWQMTQKHGTMNISCQPICTKPCTNGTCIAPETCQCLPGYKTSGKHTCKPYCSTCSQGSCIAPETCVWTSGWTVIQINGSMINSCEPICTKPCVNGTCVAPETCKYLEGYNQMEENISKPHCSSCAHGTCVGPETCICNPGWAMTKISGTNINSCQPICTKPCVNGTCVAPETCKYLEGYNKTEEIISKPHCSSCAHGSCVGPETCICNAGWAMTKINATNINSCQPICTKPCVNGTCVAPETCKYLEGYNQPEKNISKPHCSSCAHGTCVGPETCICNPGWAMTKINGTNINSCQPICTKPCVNGTCVAPETCKYLEGYNQAEENISKPHCSSCAHGTCVGPETCICNPGWAMTKINGTNINSCQPICTKPCVNGICIGPGICKCLAGYKISKKFICESDTFKADVTNIDNNVTGAEPVEHW